MEWLKKLGKAIDYIEDNTTSSFINREEGLNEHGLAAAMTFVMTRLDSLLMELPTASNCNILLADKNGDMKVAECTPFMKKIRDAESFGNGRIICTVNSFTSNEMKQYDDANGDDYNSNKRYQVVMDSFASGRIKEDYIETTKQLLKGGYGFMCQYDNEPDFETVWSSITKNK